MVCNPYKSGSWELVQAYGMDSNKEVANLNFISCSEHSAASLRSASTSATSSLRSGS